MADLAVSHVTVTRQTHRRTVGAKGYASLACDQTVEVGASGSSKCVAVVFLTESDAVHDRDDHEAGYRGSSLRESHDGLLTS